MFQTNLHYEISSSKTQARPLLYNRLIDMLCAIDELGSMTAATDKVGLSYRHFWGEIKDWEERLGGALVDSSRGRQAQLTDLARRLIRAEQQVIARNSPVLAKIRSDLEQAFAEALNPQAKHVLLCGCPDESLLKFKQLGVDAGLILDIAFSSSLQGLESLARGQCQVAGFNIPAHADLSSNAARVFGAVMDPHTMTFWHYASRTQGLVLGQKNPLQIHSLIDVARRGARFVNRAQGTGTRTVLEDLLRQSGLTPAQIQGFDREERSHQAVAQAVASGTADAGLCIESAARAFGLDFVPLVIESYYLAVRTQSLQQPEMQTLLRLLQSAQPELNYFVGYDFSRLGEPVDVPDELPWLGGGCAARP